MTRRSTRPGHNGSRARSNTLWDNEDGTFTIRDLDLAIFVYMRALASIEAGTPLGVKVEDAVKLGRAQHDVIFSGEYSVGRQLQLEMTNGYAVPCIRWCAAQRNLKRIIREFTDERFVQGRREHHR